MSVLVSPQERFVEIWGLVYERVKPSYHYDNVGGRMVRGHVIGWELRRL